MVLSKGGVREGGLLVLVTILGLVILCVGIYAEVERQKHKTLEGIFLAPAIILLLLGFTMFGVSFVGMVGSLRDNRTLLKTVRPLPCSPCSPRDGLAWFWFFCPQMNAVFHSNIQEGIRHYYDDLDFKNILDFVQEKFSCCGGDEYRDWEVNQYHSCNSSGPLACGVPYTCCVRKVPGEVINTLCGYRTLDKERLELLSIIHVRGCIHAVGLWLKDNFEATLGIVCSLLLPQVRGRSGRCLLSFFYLMPEDPKQLSSTEILGCRWGYPSAALLALCWQGGEYLRSFQNYFLLNVDDLMLI
uniref:Tetraspanin-15 n=1 Tax=Athene cunicularia TaxID=194338 RepID=A0A663M991_ATHCN